jgi:hypothetical protein
MRASHLLFASCCVLLAIDAGAQTRKATVSTPADATRLFEPIRQVLQDPRCQNCHIVGDAPLQYDAGTVHAQRVKRGADGKGVAALQCSTCHQSENPPAALGPHAPPGAPNWHLPPANMKMVFKDASAHDLCMTVKDKKRNGNRSMDDFVRHIADDPLVAWGWNPGGDRRPVSIPKEETVAAVKAWVAADAPCPRAEVN